jgi:hypothetical protein
MRNSLRRSIGTLSLVALAACGQADATTNADLERDLEQTRVAEFELANQNNKKTDVVSATERLPTGTKTPARRTPAAQSSPETMAPEVADATPATDTSLTAPRPRSTPQTQQKRGPYKTVGEIIRNAPFPINP